MENLILFIRNEDGAGMVEYSLLIALISLMLIATIGEIGIILSNTFGTIANSFNN